MVFQNLKKGRGKKSKNEGSSGDTGSSKPSNDTKAGATTTKVAKVAPPSNPHNDSLSIIPGANIKSKDRRTGHPKTAIGSPQSALKELPALRDALPNKREELFIKKLQLCGVIFSFEDPTSDKRGKDMKRQTLLELVDYVNTPAGQKNLYRKWDGRLDGMCFRKCMPRLTTCHG